MRVEQFKSVNFDSLLHFQAPVVDQKNPKLAVSKLLDQKLLVQSPPVPFIGSTQDNQLKAFGLKKGSFSKWIADLEDRITFHANANAELWFGRHSDGDKPQQALELRSVVGVTKQGRRALKVQLDDSTSVYYPQDDSSPKQWVEANVQVGDEVVLLFRLVGVQIKRNKVYGVQLVVNKVKVVETDPQFLPVERDTQDVEQNEELVVV